MELPSTLLEQITSNTTLKIQEHMLIVMDKPTHEGHLCQPLKTNNKRFKIAVIFLTAGSGIFDVTSRRNKLYFTSSIFDDNFSKLSIAMGAYLMGSLTKETKWNVVEQGFFTEANSPFTIKPNFSTLCFNIKTSSNITGRQTVFTPVGSKKGNIGFKLVLIYEEYNLSYLQLIYYRLIKFSSKQIWLTEWLSKVEVKEITISLWMLILLTNILKKLLEVLAGMRWTLMILILILVSNWKMNMEN